MKGDDNMTESERLVPRTPLVIPKIITQQLEPYPGDVEEVPSPTPFSSFNVFKRVREANGVFREKWMGFFKSFWLELLLVIVIYQLLRWSDKNSLFLLMCVVIVVARRLVWDRKDMILEKLGLKKEKPCQEKEKPQS